MKSIRELADFVSFFAEFVMFLSAGLILFMAGAAVYTAVGAVPAAIFGLVVGALLWAAGGAIGRISRQADGQ